MSVLASAQRRWPGRTYCGPMSVPPSSCARSDCCRRRSITSGNDVDTIVERVVKETLELPLNALPYGKPRGLECAALQAMAIHGALEDELGAAAAPYRVIRHPDSTRDHLWVDRYRLVREPEDTAVLDFVLGGGLFVLTNSSGFSWIGLSPGAQDGPRAATQSGSRRQR